MIVDVVFIDLGNGARVPFVRERVEWSDGTYSEPRWIRARLLDQEDPEAKQIMEEARLNEWRRDG